MQNAGVVAAANNGRVGGPGAAGQHAFVFNLGLQLVFHHAGFAGFHGAGVSPSADFRGLAHQGDFLLRFEQAQVVQQVRHVGKVFRRLGTGAHLGANLVDPGHQLVVEVAIDPHLRVDAAAAFHQARQNVVDVVDREGVVGLVLFHRAVGAGAVAVPDFPGRVFVAHEQHVFALVAAGHQHQYGIRLAKAGEVHEVAVLAKAVVYVVIANGFSGGRQNGNAILGHLFHQTLAPFGEFRRADVFHVVVLRVCPNQGNRVLPG